MKTADMVRIMPVFIKTGVVFVMAASAWAGLMMSGMRPGWSVACSLVGGTMALFVGMVLAGVKYHNDIRIMAEDYALKLDEMRNDYTKKLVTLEGAVDQLRDGVAVQRKEMAVAAVNMTKKVAESVAGKVVSRYVKNLPTKEHVDAAVLEANEIVNAEILAFGECVRKSKQEQQKTAE